jgi:hypothetical protein
VCEVRLNYNDDHGAQRRALSRIAKVSGVPTTDSAYGRRIPRPVQVLRAAIFEALRGRDWGHIEFSDALTFDRMLTRAGDTRAGKYGRDLQLAQHHLRCGKDALVEAVRMQKSRSKRGPAIEWRIYEARMNFQKAKEYQDKHERSIKK